MAKQPQVVTAVIRPSSSSPVEKRRIRPRPPPMTAANAKTGGFRTAAIPVTNKTAVPGFYKPTASTRAKSKMPALSSSKGNPKGGKHADKSGTAVKKGTAYHPAPRQRKQNPTSACSRQTVHRPNGSGRAPSVSSAAPSRRSRNSGGASTSGTAISDCRRPASGTDTSGRSQRGGNSPSLSSRPPVTSSQGQRSTRLTPASSRTRYPRTTTTSERSSAGGAPVGTPSSESIGNKRSRPAPAGSPEAHISKLRDALHQLRHTSPKFASPEFTSTRTDLASPGSVRSVRRPLSPDGGIPWGLDHHRPPDSPGQLSGRSGPLFHVQRSGSRSPKSRSRSRSGSVTPVKPHSCSAGVTWVETHNRAAPIVTSSPKMTAATDAKPEYGVQRDLPRVIYPSHVRSSPSQTRHRSVCRSGSRSDRSRSASPATSQCSRSRRRGVSPRASREAGMVTRCARGRGAAGFRAVKAGKPAGRSASDSAQRVAGLPGSIDYSPQSQYIGRLLRHGALKRSQRSPTANAPARRNSGTRGSDKENCSPRAAEQRPKRSSPRTAARRPGSAASRLSVASEPIRTRKSILRTSNHGSSEPAPRHYGYEWIDSMLDVSAPLPKTRSDVAAAKRFRDENFGATHARHDWKDTAKRMGENNKGHKCVHEYYINERLFPVPLYTDAQGRSQCPICLAVAPQSTSTGSVRASDAGSRGRPGRRRPPTATSSAGASDAGSCGRPPTAVSRRSLSPRRKQSSVSWHDEVVRASMAPGNRRGRPPRRRSPSPRGEESPPTGRRDEGRSRSPSGTRRGRSRSPAPVRRGSGSSRWRSPTLSRRRCPVSSPRTGRTSPTASRRSSTERSVVCPNCQHHVTVLADGSAVLSDSETSPAPASPRRTPASRRRPPAPQSKTASNKPARRSPVTLRSRTAAPPQPVNAMFTVPASLFSGDSGRTAAIPATSAALRPPPVVGYYGSASSLTGAGWERLGSAQWPADELDRRPRHPLWPRQLEPAAVRPIARGWPQLEVAPPAAAAAAGLPRQRAAAGRSGNAQRVPGRDPSSRRSVRDGSGAPAAGRNSYSLRRAIGEVGYRL